MSIYESYTTFMYGILFMFCSEKASFPSEAALKQIYKYAHTIIFLTKAILTNEDLM